MKQALGVRNPARPTSGLGNFPLAKVFKVGDFGSIEMNDSFARLYAAMVGVLALQGVVLELHASANPYADIGVRNIFGLKDPPPAVAPETPKEPDPPPNIKVTGITTVMNIPRALLKVQIPAKPPEPAREESYILVAGGIPQGGIQVLEIDQAHGDAKDMRVKVKYADKESWLPLEKDTAKAAAAPPPAAPPIAQGAAAQAAAQKLAAARAMAAARNRTASPAGGIPTRPVRTQGTSTPGNALGVTAETGSVAQQRSRFFNARDQVGDLTPEQQIILIEANRLNTLEDQASGLVPPPPPTELTPPELDPTVPPEPDAADLLNQALQQ